jgi:endonuclease-3
VPTRAEPAKPSTRRIRAVFNRLRKTQPPFEPKPKRPVLDELVMTLLSQATSDVNSGRAFAGLKERFPTWQEVLAAPVGEVADAIRPGGIADVKSRRIKQLLEEVRDREGRLDLQRLNGLSDSDAFDFLCSFHGVGPKTAACVLVFSMGRPAFPIDTHVHRVTKRLGLIPANSSADAAHAVLEPAVPPELRYEFHVQLIRHGREVCKARHPRCGDCVLLDLCPAGPEFLTTGEAGV